MYACDAKPEGGLACEMIAFFTAGDEEEECECWPDNWLPLQIFDALGTQWNVSYGGYVGLKYEVLPLVLDEFGVKRKARAEIIGALRIMENEALKVINKRS